MDFYEIDLNSISQAPLKKIVSSDNCFGAALYRLIAIKYYQMLWFFAPSTFFAMKTIALLRLSLKKHRGSVSYLLAKLASCSQKRIVSEIASSK